MKSKYIFLSNAVLNKYAKVDQQFISNYLWKMYIMYENVNSYFFLCQIEKHMAKNDTYTIYMI